MKLRYINCPDCQTRMIRTGKKEREHRSLDGNWIYKREYECKRCGKVIIYSESGNFIIHGSLTIE